MQRVLPHALACPRVDGHDPVVRGGISVIEERGVDYAVEADGARYALNDDATLLFKLDADNRVRERIRIERPEAKYNETITKELTVIRFVASPDGKYLIIFLGVVDGC